MWFRNISVLLSSLLIIIFIFNNFQIVKCDKSDTDSKVLLKLSNKCISEHDNTACLQQKALEGLIKVADEYEFVPGISLARNVNNSDNVNRKAKSLTGEEDPENYILHRTEGYLNSHVVKVNLARALDGWQTAVGYSPNQDISRSGRNTFLTGFGLGFLAFALKKLLLPVFIGAQIIKSVLLAMFLPTLLSGIGKFLGKSGATVFGASSGPSEDFDFKDNYDPSSYDTAASTNTAAFTYPQAPQNRYETASDTYTNPSKYYFTGTDNTKFATNQYNLQSLYKKPGTAQYRRPQTPTHSNMDFSAFQKIPSASLMLSDYDPFYSPLLSRLDSIFKQMGYDQGEEACREKLVCNMYKNPAKYVPYSNLVSAQLSRELNELHKPNGNPGVLRFFRYMKAAKDGQDGNDCTELYSTCLIPDMQAKATEDGLLGAASPPMVQTYHEINKLVQARRLAKQMATNPSSEGTNIQDATTSASA